MWASWGIGAEWSSVSLQRHLYQGLGVGEQWRGAGEDICKNYKRHVRDFPSCCFKNRGPDYFQNRPELSVLRGCLSPLVLPSLGSLWRGLSVELAEGVSAEGTRVPRVREQRSGAGCRVSRPDGSTLESVCPHIQMTHFRDSLHPEPWA